MFALFLVLAAVMVIQEARKRGSSQEPEYVMNDAVRFIGRRLRGAGLEHIDEADVRSILEWEVFHLQDLARRAPDGGVDIVVGGSEEAVEFVLGKTAVDGETRHTADEVRLVMALEAEYLVSIGAVGAPAQEERA